MDNVFDLFDTHWQSVCEYSSLQSGDIEPKVFVLPVVQRLEGVEQEPFVLNGDSGELPTIDKINEAEAALLMSIHMWLQSENSEIVVLV